MSETRRHQSEPSTHRAPLVTRAWHVLMTNGGGETIVAHQAQVRSGVLSFRNRPKPEHKNVLVRAFAPHVWLEVNLVDTPASGPVHLPVVHDIPGHRPSWR